MILMIDNYDSFTFNLVQMLQFLGETVCVCRNDQIDLPGLWDFLPSAMVLSPGPGTPLQAGICVAAIHSFAPKIPILGVCLGHHAIVHAFGGQVIRAKKIMHGKTSAIFHDDRTIYQGISNPFSATRYHSLIAERDSLPDCLEISAWTEAGEVMGVRHSIYGVEGVQFHPESILTESGSIIIENFIHQSFPMKGDLVNG